MSALAPRRTARSTDGHASICSSHSRWYVPKVRRPAYGRASEVSQVNACKGAVVGGAGVIHADDRRRGCAAQRLRMTHRVRVFLRSDRDADRQRRAGATLLAKAADPDSASLTILLNAAIDSRNSQLIVSGDRATDLRAGAVIIEPTPAIVGQGGSLSIDPSVRLVPFSGASSIAGTIAVTTTWLPSLTAQGAAPGQVVHADLFAPAGDIAAVFTSVAAPPVNIGFGVGVWLDPATVFLTGIGVVDATGHYRRVCNCPQTPRSRSRRGVCRPSAAARTVASR